MPVPQVGANRSMLIEQVDLGGGSALLLLSVRFATCAYYVGWVIFDRPFLPPGNLWSSLASKAC